MRPIARKNIVVRLEDGPCAGSFATIKAFNRDVWQRLGPRQQAWCRYVKDMLRPGVFVWSGEMVTTEQLALMLKRHTTAGNTYGQSQGA